MSEQRLYGLPGAEVMYFDPAEVYESEIEPLGDGPDTERWCIEEWTVREPVKHIPSASSILTHIVDCVCEYGEIDEQAAEQWGTKTADPDVIAATENLRMVLASKITYRMADKHIADHALTWDDNGEPLYDGQPMYVDARKADA